MYNSQGTFAVKFTYEEKVSWHVAVTLKIDSPKFRFQGMVLDFRKFNEENVWIAPFQQQKKKGLQMQKYLKII